MNNSANISNHTDIGKRSDAAIELPYDLAMISFYVITVQCIVGIIGNIVSFIVWVTGRRSSRLSCAFYFKCLTACDTLALTYRLVNEMVYNEYIGMNSWSNAWCIVINFCFYSAPQISAWIIVCLSIERMLSLCFPFRFQTQGAAKRAKMALLACLVTLTALNSLLTYASCPLVNLDLYYILEESSNIYFLCVLPLLFLTASNVIVIARMCWLRRNGVRSNRGQNIAARVTIISIFTGLLQCISILPTMLVYLQFLQRVDILQSYEASYIALWVSHMTMYLNNCLNFVIYCFIGKDFRKDFKERFCCRREVG